MASAAPGEDDGLRIQSSSERYKKRNFKTYNCGRERERERESLIEREMCTKKTLLEILCCDGI